MGMAWTLLGSVLVVLAWLDVVQTSLTMKAGGPLTRQIIRLYGLFLIYLPNGRTANWLRSQIGTLSLMTTLISWVAMLWTGWWLVFCGDPEAVVHGTTNAEAGWLDRLYVAGYAISTLGTGDFVANTAAWRVVLAVAGTTGFALMTLSITYALPIMGGVVEIRTLALTIGTLGDTVKSLEQMWMARQSASDHLGTRLQSIESDLARVDRQHAVYPVLHLFTSRDARTALDVNLARLYDFLLIASRKTPKESVVAGGPVAHCKALVERYAHTLGTMRVGGIGRGHPAESPVACTDRESTTRNTLAARIEAHGWRWEHVDVAKTS
jgi:hypothetical protein